MFLKRRDTIACLLILAAALAWTAGQKIMNQIPGAEDQAAVATTFAATRRTEGTAFGFTEDVTEGLSEDFTEYCSEDFSEINIEDLSDISYEDSYGELSAALSEVSAENLSETATDMFSEDFSGAATDIFSEDFSETATVMFSTEFFSGESLPEEAPALALPPDLWGFLLRALAVAAAFVSIFLLFRKSPSSGPDGAGLLLILADASFQNSGYMTRRMAVILYFVAVLLLLYALRELWGWLLSRCSLSWCALCRLIIKSRQPSLSLGLLFGWNLISILLLIGLLTRYPLTAALLSLAGLLLAALTGIGCLYKYGADLQHFQKQLELFQKGLPVTVKEHSFIQAETQLSAVSAQHEEAIRTAVTSERFKVELISNVSHDLRTPLTSILGYGELLEKEKLSPTGEEQLKRLNQKAGYMLELVESLFELTKVSSGAAECKKEEIDLIRLLEQTIGLFDDQLTAAGLSIRRQYETPSLLITTDGSRLHQVFANLLGNAIKYALPGTRIYLEVKCRETECAVRMVNTASYEMDFQPEEILQRFARGDKARSTQGSGLGLAIAQTYTESVGGQFQVVIDGDQFHAVVKLPL